MAEEFVIRVQVENLQGRSAAPRTGAEAEQRTGTGIGNPALANLESSLGTQFSVRRDLGPKTFARDEVINKKILEDAGYRDVNIKRGIGILTYPLRARGEDASGQFFDETLRYQTRFGEFAQDIGQQVPGFLNQHRARIRATTTIAVNSIIQSNLAIRAHRSGDSYRNQTNANTARIASSLSSIGIASAIWGPSAAIAFTANFAISEGARMYTQNANWKFDRKMDTEYVHNITEVAGNISYGRGFR